MPLMMPTLIMLMLVLMPKMVLEMIYMAMMMSQTQKTLTLMNLMIQTLSMTRFSVGCGPALLGIMHLIFMT